MGRRMDWDRVKRGAGNLGYRDSSGAAKEPDQSRPMGAQAKQIRELAKQLGYPSTMPAVRRYAPNVASFKLLTRADASKILAGLLRELR